MSLIGTNASLVFRSPHEDGSSVGGVAMTLEEFTRAHQLPERWLSLRRECEALVSNPRYWYRSDMQNAARIVATEASDILHARLADRKQRDVLCNDEGKGTSPEVTEFTDNSQVRLTRTSRG